MNRRNAVGGVRNVYSQAGKLKIRSKPVPPKIRFDDKPVEGREITLQVCQGLGDIFWVYQKFSPYFDKINFAVCVLEKTPIQLRSLEWLECFPKVGKSFAHVVNSEEYSSLFENFSSMKVAIDDWEKSGIVAYSCNRWLETGTRLEDIDPGSLVEWSVPMKTEAFDLPFEEYATVYVSGSTSNPALKNDPKFNIWSVDQWILYINGVWKKYDLKWPVIVLGAEFDKKISEEIVAGLKSHNIDAQLMLQEKPSRVLYCLSKSKFHIGYQSGLNIVVDNFGVNQMMVYFPYLQSMLYTWCKKEHIESVFLADTFDKEPAKLLAKYKLFNKS